MPRQKVDKSQCRYCRNREPMVTMVIVKGSMTGECTDCYKSRQRVIRLNNALQRGFYRSMPELTAANYKLICSVPIGTYAIRFRTNKALLGFVAIRETMIFVDVSGIQNAFNFDAFGVASFIGNQNCMIAEPLTVFDADDKPVPIAEIGRGFPIVDVQERLVWYDKSLQSKALKVIRAEINDAKRKANMQKAQSIRNNSRVQKTP